MVRLTALGSLKIRQLWMLLLAAVQVSVDGTSQRRPVRVLMDPNKNDCYYIPEVKFRQDVTIEFQVIKSDYPGDETGMNIRFSVYDPQNVIMHSSLDKQTEIYFFNARENGDYKICLYSYYGRKVVFLSVAVTDPKDSGRDVYDYEYDEDDYFEKEDLEAMRERDRQVELEVAVKEIKASLQEIRKNVHRASMIQGFRESTLTKDHYLMLNNYGRVNVWSLVHVVVLVTTGLVQVFVLKRLFNVNDSRRKV